MEFAYLIIVGIVVYSVRLNNRLRRAERQIALLVRTQRSRDEQALDREEPAASAPPRAPVPERTAEAVPERVTFPRVSVPPFSAARAPVPAPAPVEAKPQAEPFYQRIIAGGFEELFGSRLPIWAGGITLAVAGLFIVKYSIDQGLLSETVRVGLGLAFSLFLLAGAEASRQWKQIAIDPRVAQALSGAGIAAAYGSILMAVNVYAIIDAGAGFVAMALITAASLGLALRYGAPSAVLGLVGGLAAPALVGTNEPNMPLLALYLILAIGGLSAVARREKWGWLATGALLGGFGWGAAMLLGSFADTLSIGVVGGYLLLLGLAVPLLAFGQDTKIILRAVPAGLAAVQIAVLVIRGGYAPFEWGLYGLLAIGTIILARIDTRLHVMPRIAMLVALFTLAAWPTPSLPLFVAVVAGIFVLFVLPPLLVLWRQGGRLADALQASTALIALYLIAAIKLPGEQFDPNEWGAIALACAGVTGSAAARGWARTDRQGDARFAVIMGVTTLFVATGLSLIFAEPAVPAALAAVIAAITAFHAARPDWNPRLAGGTAALFLGGWLAEPVGMWASGTIATFYGDALLVMSLATATDALTHLLAPAIILGAALWTIRHKASQRLWRLAAALSAALGLIGLFILFKQIFAIDDQAGVEAYALAERIVLTQILFGTAYFIWRMRDRHPALLRIAIGIAALAIGRTIIYDLLVFNPLLVRQAVGALPVINLLIPAYLFPLGWLIHMVRSEETLRRDVAARVSTVTTMALVIMFAFASLAQIFHGSFPATGALSESEDIARSFLAIALAVGFLRYGIHARDRVWRITSLVMMLGAVAKVFVFDASGLDGLMRIGSFIALGFSLIGIGWLYSRHLKVDTAAA